MQIDCTRGYFTIRFVPDPGFGKRSQHASKQHFASYLFHSDVEFSLRQLSESGMMGIHQVIPFISLSCLVVDLALIVINRKALEPYMDPDLYYMAALLIPIVLNGMRTRGLQIMSSSISWSSLWQALITCCRWCGDEKIFLKPGAPELADMVVSTLEACLGMSQDICGATEDTEVLHAAVMSHTMVIEKLVQIAAANPFGSVGKSTIKDYNQLVNVAAIRYHYEVQIAALGVRGHPTFEQALAGSRKKGFTSLRLKPKHAGPGHPYVKGTAEIRMPSNLVRVLATETEANIFWAAKIRHGTAVILTKFTMPQWIFCYHMDAIILIKGIAIELSHWILQRKLRRGGPIGC